MRRALFSLSPFVLAVVVGCGEPPGLAACGDGVDSDGDAFIDEADPGCDNAEDEDENDPQCADGLDNDFDGLADALDPECAENPNAEADLQALPDLKLSESIATFTNPFIETVQVDANDPEFLEGCFLGTGTRTIFRFDGTILNIGDGDLIVGNTDQHQPPYTFNDNFQQLQFEGWLNYTLLNSDRTDTGVRGHKGSFCMLDLVPVQGFNNPPKFNDCVNNQGITVGQADVYNAQLDCQFIDVTGLPAGNYIIQAEVNSTRELPEKDYTNNVKEYEIALP